MSTSATKWSPVGTGSFFMLASHRSPVSSSGKAIFEDEIGPNPVSSSGKAVYEDEMSPAEGSATGTPIFVSDSKCRWGRGGP